MVAGRPYDFDQATYSETVSHAKQTGLVFGSGTDCGSCTRQSAEDPRSGERSYTKNGKLYHYQGFGIARRALPTGKVYRVLSALSVVD
jgi:hypothetical protein